MPPIIRKARRKAMKVTVENGKTVFRTNNGNKLYPVCNWERNQHKIYNYIDRCKIAEQEAFLNGSESEVKEAYERSENAERLIEVFNGFVIDGVVYAEYNDYKAIKNVIAGYDYRH